MKRVSSALWTVVLAIGICFGAAEASAELGKTATTESLVGGNTAFALDLFQRLRQTPGNLFYSPFSISSTVAMALAGAHGETETEISKVLGFARAGSDVHAAFGKLVGEVTSSGNQHDNQLSLANALWAAKGHRLLQEYVSLLQSQYRAGVEELDFARDTKSARKTINSWIEEKTSGHIKDLIPEGALSPQSRLVLTNAVYFKGTWASTFDDKITAPGQFTVSRDKRVSVPMMKQSSSFNYFETDTCQVLEMPYRGGTLSMVVILPRQQDGLAKLEASLNPRLLEELMAGLAQFEVDVSLPKFKMRSRFNLAGELKALGMAGAFSSPPADFSRMNGKKDLFISEAVHEAFVDVTEKGTEAAAATALTFGVTLSMSRKQFKADHPFVFLIRDRRSKSVLFIGRVANPEAR